MKAGDEVYGWFGGPGPDLHIGIVREVTEDGRASAVYDACCNLEITDASTMGWKPMTDKIAAIGIQYGHGFHVNAGTYSHKQLLDIARDKLAKDHQGR